MTRFTPLLFWLCVLPAVIGAQKPNDPCIRCHTQPGLNRAAGEGDSLAVVVDLDHFQNSVHGKATCTSCHQDLTNVSQWPHAKRLKPVDCSSCHIVEGQQFAISTHWHLNQPDKPEGMSCPTCHGRHDILKPSDPQSRTSRQNIVQICSTCHAQEEISPGSGITVSAYQFSVHGQKALQGNTRTAECVDCHGSHKVLPADNPLSPIYKPHIPETCGRCHPQILTDYELSIHGQAVAKGLLEAPVCTDCHGEHTIQTPAQEKSSVAPIHIPETCGKCHENVALAQKFGLPAQRFTTYENSYHGVAIKYGKTLVANCASCHGYHKILPPEDSASTINPKNLAQTCGQCHANAGVNFTKGKMHVQATMENSPGVFVVRRFYYLFIGLLMVLFVLYMLIDYYGFKRRRSRKKNS